MKIDPHSPVYSSALRELKRKKRAEGGDDFSGLLDDLDETEGAAATEAPARVAASPLVGGILAVQEVAEDDTRRGRAIKHGHRMLDALEDLRMSLLLGEIPPEQLEAIRVRMQEQKETVRDPQLQEVMNEIEIRAAVELAKQGY